MHDIVKVGIGREARRIYKLDDIALAPTHRTRSSKDVDTSWRIGAYDFEPPMMMHPTDAIASPESVAEFARLGGLAVLNIESIWARHADAQDKIAELMELAEDAATKYESEAVNRKPQGLHSAPIDTDLLVERIKKIRATGAITTAHVSPQHARELAPLAIRAGIDLLVIQDTLISAEHVTAQEEPLSLKDFIGSLDVPVIADGIVDYQTALHLMRSSATGVIVGTDFTTSPDALGIDASVAAAVTGTAAACKGYLDKTEGRYVHIIADGDIDTADDIVGAIVCGTDAVTLSSVLATVGEVPGQGYAWPSVAAHPKYPRSVVWPAVDDEKELVSLEEALFGPSASPFGDHSLAGGLRRAMAKYGFTNLKPFHRVELSVCPKDF